MRVRLDGLNRLLDKHNLVQRTNPSTILISLDSAFSSGAMPSVSCQRLCLRSAPSGTAHSARQQSRDHM